MTGRELEAVRKLAAIRTLIDHGRRGSEWQEAGLLHAIEKIVKDEVSDLSSQTLSKLIDEASRN